MWEEESSVCNVKSLESKSQIKIVQLTAHEKFLKKKAQLKTQQIKKDNK